jgi:hydroxymethylpyrimidine pyrophosphatase-like HAD family hydrolase
VAVLRADAKDLRSLTVLAKVDRSHVLEKRSLIWEGLETVRRVHGHYRTPPMALRCVYTDLDGTLLGPRGGLFRDPEGNFSLAQAKALQACDRADVEVVVMSGRREAEVQSDSRLMGQTSYIYEAGCGVFIDGERTFLTGAWQPDESSTPYERMVDAGIPDLLFERYSPKLEWHTPWEVGRKLSFLMRGEVDSAEVNELLIAEGQTDLRFLDNGVISYRMEAVEGHTHAYHLVPGGASKAKGVEFHRRARGYDADSCIAIGDSIEDLESSVSVGRFFCVANGPRNDQALRDALRGFGNVTVTEGAMGDGFYEAIVTSLMGA